MQPADGVAQSENPLIVCQSANRVMQSGNLQFVLCKVLARLQSKNRVYRCKGRDSKILCVHIPYIIIVASFMSA